MTNTLLTLHDPAAAREHYRQGLWREDTLFSLLARHARQRPQDFAVRDGAARLTWGALLRLVEAVAADLHAAGLKRGERVAVWLPNRIEAIAVFLACSRQGYVCNPSLHRNFTLAEIAGLLARTRAAALFFQPGYGADAERTDIAAALAGLKLRRVYAVGGDRDLVPGAAPFPMPGSGAEALPPADGDPDKIVYLAFTSGTTGTPKGVMHSDNTLLANGRVMVEDLAHDHRTILLSLSPLSHHIATVGLAQALAAGFELAVNAPPPGMSELDWIVESDATYLMGVPTHAIDLLAEMRRRGIERLGRVGVFYMSGAPIPRELAQALLDRGVVPQNCFGMTENGSHVYTLPGDPADTIVATCGRTCRAYDIRIWDQDKPDIEAAPGEIGEIGGRGACLTLGYFDDQEATEGSFNRHGWFMSGDLGRLDGNGCLEIAGRKKDLIIRGGHNIHPARIEDLTMRHKSVARCAAFAVADERLGERVCLSVVFHDGMTAAPEDLLAHLHGAGLSRYDMPEYFVAMTAYPLTASGKILKRQLVEWARSGRIAPVPVRWTGAAGGEG